MRGPANNSPMDSPSPVSFPSGSLPSGSSPAGNSPEAIIAILQKHVQDYPLPSASAVAERKSDPFHILVSTMISLRTKNEVSTTPRHKI